VRPSPPGGYVIPRGCGWRADCSSVPQEETSMLISEIRWSVPSRVLLYGGIALHFTFVMLTVGRQIGFPLLVFYLALIAFLTAFQTLRVRMEGMDLQVGFPIFNRRIPLHDIDRIQPIHYGWLQWGGWGVRIRRGAVMYNVPGDKGRAV